MARKYHHSTPLRLSVSKVTQLLRDKTAALSTTDVFESSPATLGRALAKRLDNYATEREETRERIKIAAEVVRGYVPEGGKLEALLDEVLKSALSAAESSKGSK